MLLLSPHELHGVNDNVIPIGFARATVAALKANGSTAELHELPSTAHQFTDAMGADLLAHLREQVSKQL